MPILRKRTRLVAAGLAGALAVLGAWQAAAPAAEPAEGGHWQKPERRSVAQPLQFKGTLLPAASVNIVAPVDGRLAERSAQFGDKVASGQVLGRVESAELQHQLREAEIGAIRAEQELAAAQHLEQGGEYQAALRRLAGAEAALTVSQRRRDETQMLYDKGIVARTELDGVGQEQDNAVAQLQGARDEMAQLKRKKSREALRILELDLQSRQERLQEFRAKREAMRLVSPIDGVVLYPIAGESSDGGPAAPGAREFKPGSYVTTRDVILSVGDTATFLVKIWVEEGELPGIAVRQPARITVGGDALHEWDGEVQRMSSQARTGDARGPVSQGPPEFEVQILVRPPPGASPRVGAAVKVKLTPAVRPAGWFVPLAAVTWGAEGEPLLRVRGEDGKPVLRPVVLARTTVDAVELRAGVEADSEVWVPDGAGRAGARPASFLARLFSTGDDHD